jgi:ABC-2 type transport system permease protein
MRSVLSSELLRFRSRRLVVVLSIGALIGTAVGCVIAAIASTPPTGAALAEARARAEREVSRCLAADWSGVDLEGRSLEEFCREQFEDATQYLPSHLALVDLPGILEGIASITSIIGVVVGASFVAASWQTGTITTILTWEPRRARWFASRLLIASAGVFVLVVVLLMFLSVGLWIASSLRGSTIGADGSLWTDVVATWVRIALVAGVAAAIAGAIAAVGRYTAAALGVLFVYAAVIEGLIRGLRPLWTPWLLGDNIVTFVSWRTLEVQYSPIGSYTLRPGISILVILGYAAVALALGFTFVRVRDVQ